RHAHPAFLQNRLLAQVKSSRSINRFLILHGRPRTSSDRGRPARFGASLGSLTTTRPIVRPNYLPARTRFIQAGSTNPIFCCPCCPCDRHSRLRVRVSNPTLFSSPPPHLPPP